MSKYSEYRARLSVDIPDELHERLRRVVPWGMIGKLMNTILWDVVKMLEKDPNMLGILLNRYITYPEILKTLDKEGGGNATS